MQTLAKKPKKRSLRKAKLYPETDVQVNVLKWLALANPIARKAAIRIGNEGKRSAAGHALDKAMGLYAGASDLFLAFPVRGYHGLWLEVKPEGWKATPSKMEHHQRQLDFIEHMKSLGYQGAVGVGFDGCVGVLKGYLG